MNGHMGVASLSVTSGLVLSHLCDNAWFRILRFSNIRALSFSLNKHHFKGIKWFNQVYGICLSHHIKHILRGIQLWIYFAQLWIYFAHFCFSTWALVNIKTSKWSTSGFDGYGASLCWITTNDKIYMMYHYHFLRGRKKSSFLYHSKQGGSLQQHLQLCSS